MNRRPEQLTAADMIRELIRPYVTRHAGTFGLRTRVPVPRTDGPKYAWTTAVLPATHHTANHPALLDQLEQAAGIRSAVSDDDAGASAFGSKPPTHLEALRLIDRIDRQSRQMEHRLGIAHVPGVRPRLSRIGGLLGIEPDPTVRSWWASARILTHWDTPAYRPQGAPCPQCWETNSIRIRFDDELAVCSECGTVWDREGGTENGSLDLLGQHVAWCTDHDVTKPRHWLYDDHGYPVECVECLPFRDAYTQWRVTRESNKQHGHGGRRVS